MSNITLINAGLILRDPIPPIGPLILASVLRSNGHNVTFRDFQTHNVKNRLFFSTFEDFIDTDDQIIGFSVFCTSLPLVLGTITKIKQKNPNKIVILGGAGVNEIQIEIMSHFPVDYILYGEGEESIVELLEAIEAGEGYDKIKGLVYIEGNQIIKNAPRDRLLDLSSVPLPAYDLIDLSKYGKIAYLLTSRGCPFGCKFCATNSIWHRIMAYRSIESVIEELTVISKQCDFEQIAIIDDTFVLDKERSKNLLTRIRENGFFQPFSCNGKISLMNEEWLKILDEKGCNHIFYGVEAGNDTILNIIDKGHTIEQALTIIKQTSDYIPSIRASFIWGYPFETIDDFYDLIEILYELMAIKEVKTQLSLCSPIPGSELHLMYGSNIDFRIDTNSRAGGLPVEEDLEDYVELQKLILLYPDVFPSFYYFKQDNFEEKLNIIKSVDWIYNQNKLKKYKDKIVKAGQV